MTINYIKLIRKLPLDQAFLRRVGGKNKLIQLFSKKDPTEREEKILFEARIFIADAFFKTMRMILFNEK